MYIGYRTERRKSRRYQVNLAALYTIDAPDYVRDILDGRGDFEGNVIDLSEAGMGMSVPHYLPKYTTLKIKMVLLETSCGGSVDFHHPLTLSGEIRSIGLGKDQGYRVGICFTQVTTSQKILISDLLSLGLSRRAHHSVQHHPIL